MGKIHVVHHEASVAAEDIERITGIFDGIDSVLKYAPDSPEESLVNELVEAVRARSIGSLVLPLNISGSISNLSIDRRSSDGILVGNLRDDKDQLSFHVLGDRDDPNARILEDNGVGVQLGSRAGSALVEIHYLDLSAEGPETEINLYNPEMYFISDTL